MLDDRCELRGDPGTFVKLVGVDGDRLAIDRASTPAAVAWNGADVHPIVRGWNHRATDTISLSNGAIPIVEGTGDGGWIDLEHGIQIQFQPAGTTPRAFRSGDYWLIPARNTTGNIEWPSERGSDGKEMKDADGNVIKAALPPHGVEHRYAPLAVIRLDGGSQASVELDLRRTIAQLGQ